MLFSSITFLYIFLPLVLLLYAFVPEQGRNLVLLLMSLLFYAWGEPIYVLLMLAQIGIVYVLSGFKGRIFFLLSVLVPFAALFYFKFSNTFPIGISFYTFQLASYSIDVYRGQVARQRNFIVLAAYVTLFPQLVAGPIVRYSDVENTLANKRNVADRYENLEYGIVRFAIGLGKKVLIANVIGEFVTEVSQLSGRTLALSWGYAIAVALQIYFDFSGYSDMAIGLGRMMGFYFPENFRYPFISGSISEFWRRWHITLGSWFRDYMYIPMGGNRVGMVHWIFNIFVVWGFTGLWHGAEWNFILWGLLFAVLLIFEKICKLINQKFMPSIGSKECGKWILSIVRHGYVVFFILISFLIFHNTDLERAATDIVSLWNNNVLAITDTSQKLVCDYMLRNRIVILAIGLVAATPLPVILWGRFQKWLRMHRGGDTAVHLLRAVSSVALLLLCTAYIIDGSFNPFLYFRF